LPGFKCNTYYIGMSSRYTKKCIRVYKTRHMLGVTSDYPPAIVLLTIHGRIPGVVRGDRVTTKHRLPFASAISTPRWKRGARATGVDRSRAVPNWPEGKPRSAQPEPPSRVGPSGVQREESPVYAGASIPRCSRSPHPEHLDTRSPWFLLLS
jgi:hypothetical protein